jgi:PAS domain-containing protein
MAKTPTIPFQDLAADKLEAVLERIGPLVQPQDFQLLQQVVATLVLVLEWLQRKTLSLRRLRQMIFGPKTEKSNKVLPKDKDKDKATDPAPGQSTGANGPTPPKEKKKGHGRNGVGDYPGAERMTVPHQTLQPGCPCPLCRKGRLYDMNKPALVIRIVAQPFFPGKIYELMRLRCSSCLMIFTAQAPAEAGISKYSEEVPAMLAVLRYGMGMPLFRIQKFQQSFGVPLPAATQWDLLWAAALLLMPILECLIARAAQAWLFYHDDTRMKVLSLMEENASQADPGCDSKERTGIFTTGILAQVGEYRIALFFTGRKHAGENLQSVLDQRQEGLARPIQMCDGLSSNQLKTSQTQEANCHAHSRRKYAEVVEAFPQECRLVLETLKEVYKNDAKAKELGLSPEQRLLFHQTHSQKPMEELERWARERLEQKKVEPNSGLGQAINYMLKRWDKLTLFLRQAGVPLDNNLCEQILKRAILHRKNSMFYRNERGAMVGDLYMSLIETCRLCGVNPLEYLTVLQKHARRVSENPEQWLPWNFREALAAANTS